MIGWNKKSEKLGACAEDANLWLLFVSQQPQKKKIGQWEIMIMERHALKQCGEVTQGLKNWKARVNLQHPWYVECEFL